MAQCCLVVTIYPCNNPSICSREIDPVYLLHTARFESWDYQKVDMLKEPHIQRWYQGRLTTVNLLWVFVYKFSSRDLIKTQSLNILSTSTTVPSQQITSILYSTIKSPTFKMRFSIPQLSAFFALSLTATVTATPVGESVQGWIKERDMWDYSCTVIKAESNSV